MLIVSDIHGEFEALAGLAASGETLLVLGDLINLLDYRTGEGIISDVMGDAFGRQVSVRRGDSDYSGMRRLWSELSEERIREVRSAMREAAHAQYEECRSALDQGTGYVTYGNVDRPEMLQAALPEGMRFVDGDRVEIDGLVFGFVGGGISTPVHAEGEVTDREMTDKLESLGPVDVLCTHLSPRVGPLHRDVITGRLERSSVPILDYLHRYQPRLHFFGDVHQPQATRWRVGPTLCQNVGYFRATRRPFRFDPAADFPG
ncbi:MAG TPA: metallophosphoesterase family protein [Acidimicrobiia bacterium]|nr:metallophosphoesterase family protein [Acidimicrobiia bacterium]